MTKVEHRFLNSKWAAEQIVPDKRLYEGFTTKKAAVEWAKKMSAKTKTEFVVWRSDKDGDKIVFRVGGEHQQWMLYDLRKAYDAGLAEKDRERYDKALIEKKRRWLKALKTLADNLEGELNEKGNVDLPKGVERWYEWVETSRCKNNIAYW